MEETVSILMVDDDEVDRIAVRRTLKSTGVKTKLSETDSCAGALAALQQHHFDCVFLDYRLPDGDGLSLVQQIRALGITVPLIVLTGQGDEQIAVQIMKAGAYDYLSKSKLSPEILTQILRNSIRLHQAEKEIALTNKRLQESEERYRLVLEASNDGIWDWYCRTDEVYCNDRLLEIIGLSRSQASPTYSNFIALIHPEDLPKVRTAVNAHLTQGVKCEIEFRLRHASGEYRYCWAKGKAQRDASGCPERMSGVLSDITERKQLEEALRTSESRYRRLVESNVIGIILADMGGKIIDANDAFLQMVGYTQEELRAGQLQWQKMTPPEYESLDRQALQELRTFGAFTPFEKEYLCKDGRRIPILLGGALVEGMQETAICFTLDLTPRKRSEAENVKLNRDLERRIGELETLLDVIPMGIAIAQDPECKYIRVNTVLAQLLELAPDTNASKTAPLTEQPTYKVYRYGKEIPATQLPMQYAAANGVEVLNTELDVVLREGESTIKLLANAAPLFDEKGKCRGSIGAFLDITERKRSEDQERFLAEASAILAASLEYQTTLKNLARSIVPQLADWCCIYVIEQDGSVHPVTINHTDPQKEQRAKNLQRRFPIKLNGTYGTPQVIRSGKSVLYPEISDAFLIDTAHNAEHLQALSEMKFKSMMTVPLQARGRTLGAISFITAESGRIYTPADLIFAEDLGRRAGLAVDNARLYREANEIGENLRQAIIILGEQQQQLRVLQRITNLLNQRLTDLSNLLQVMVGAICDGIPEAEFAAIAIYNPRNQELDLTATAGIGRERLLLTELLEPDDGLLKQVFITGESKLICRNLPPKSRGEAPQAVSRNPASIYAVAIASAQAGRLGVLVVGNWENSDAFDLEDRNLLAAVGEQAAIAINNARMINALEEREERLAIQNLVLGQQNRELELTRQRIEQQNVQLIEAARLKSQFLATMSHELRTPMNAIIGFAQVLLRQRNAKLSAAQTDMMQRILNNGKNLLALINDILDLSKIEAGRLELQHEEIDLTQLILTTVAEIKPLAEQKHLPLRVDAKLANSQIVNDRTRLRQILVNLLSNAIKFTDAGSVEVKAKELSPQQLEIAVKDTGIGIAESELEHIFEEFRQVDQTTTRKHGGTGLGLAITKSLVGMMQGTILVESKLGQGSTFSVILPRKTRE